MLELFRFKPHYPSKGGVEVYSVKNLYRDKFEECSNKSMFFTVKTHSPLLKKNLSKRKHPLTVVPVLQNHCNGFYQCWMDIIFL
jgi:hypothetical protein